ncbi:MAG: imelysin family protein [Paracoccaceae bacterium]
MKKLLLILILALPVSGRAQDRSETIRAVIEQHILPGFINLAVKTNDLSEAAAKDCSATFAPLQMAYHDAFDAWMAVSHLQFGPLETENRTFDLAFWPDPRSFTSKALTALISTEDPVAENADDFASVSVAAKGFYGLEFLLFDPRISTLGSDMYRCQLARVITENLSKTAQDVLTDWQERYVDLMLHPNSDAIYRSDEEVLKTLFNSLTTGLQFTSEIRLGRPLGTFEKPRPRRAEARRSGRSLRNISLSLQALDELGHLLAQDYQIVADSFGESADRAMQYADDLDEPVFAGVVDPQSRLKIEILQQKVEHVSTVVSNELGPTLGVVAGFNSMDGD